MQRFLRTFDAWHARLSRFAFALACGVLVLLTTVFNIEVFSRYILNSPTLWTADVIAISMLLITFLALPYITLQKDHVKLDLVTQKLSKRYIRLYSFANFLIFILTLSVVGIYMILEVYHTYSNGARVASVIPIRKWPLMAVMAYGFVSSLLHVITDYFNKDAA